MAQVLVTPAAREDLERMIRTHSLPADTVARVAGSLRALESFPLLGPALEGRWDGFRFVLGPWRWMIVVYLVDDARERVSVVTIQDARSSSAATGTRERDA